MFKATASHTHGSLAISKFGRNTCIDYFVLVKVLLKVGCEELLNSSRIHAWIGSPPQSLRLFFACSNSILI